MLEAAFVRIDDTGSQQAPLVISIVNVIGGGGEQEWSVEELQVLGRVQERYGKDASSSFSHSPSQSFFKISL